VVRGDSHYEQVAQVGREVVYALLAQGGDDRLEFEETAALAGSAMAEDPALAAEQLLAIAGKAIAAVLVYECALASANAGRRFGQAAGRGVWEALTTTSGTSPVAGDELLAAIEGFGRGLAAPDPLAPDVAEREHYHQLGERVVVAYRAAEPPGSMTPVGAFPDEDARAAGYVIGAVTLFIGTLSGHGARQLGETAARGVGNALAMFLSPVHEDRPAHLQAATEGFAGQLAQWVIGGFTAVTPGHC
jgi:hypothetical protein